MDKKMKFSQKIATDHIVESDGAMVLFLIIWNSSRNCI